MDINHKNYLDIDNEINNIYELNGDLQFNKSEVDIDYENSNYINFVDKKRGR